MEERISLRTRDDLVILKSDKGNNTVIMDKTKYMQKANSLLNTQTSKSNATLRGKGTFGAIGHSRTNHQENYPQEFRSPQIVWTTKSS